MTTFSIMIVVRSADGITSQIKDFDNKPVAEAVVSSITKQASSSMNRIEVLRLYTI